MLNLATVYRELKEAERRGEISPSPFGVYRHRMPVSLPSALGQAAAAAESRRVIPLPPRALDRGHSTSEIRR